MKKDKKKKLNTSDKGFFLWVPEEIFLSGKLNNTEMYIFGALLSLSNNPYTLKNGLKLLSKDLANKLGISTRVLQYSIKALSEIIIDVNDVYQGPLITINKVNQKKYKQIITLNFFSKDAFILIPTEIINDHELSIASKIFYGQTFAARNGYSYSSIIEISEYTRYHKSSVYRHINTLINKGWIIRDSSDNGYRYLPQDIHSEKAYLKKQNNPRLKIKRLLNRKNKKEPNAPPTNHIGISPEDEHILDSIWKDIAIIPSKKQPA